MDPEKPVEALAFSPHPDDAEMGCGGLLLKLKDKGYRTGIVDLTRAELSTNGDLQTRKKETSAASRILGLDIRENLRLEDTNIKNDTRSRTRVINVIRKYRPKMVLIPYFKDRHPDHENSFKLLKDSIFISGLQKFQTDHYFFSPQMVFSYIPQLEERGVIVVYN